MIERGGKKYPHLSSYGPRGGGYTNDYSVNTTSFAKNKE
jgi:hypothetical protein